MLLGLVLWWCKVLWYTVYANVMCCFVKLGSHNKWWVAVTGQQFIHILWPWKDRVGMEGRWGNRQGGKEDGLGPGKGWQQSCQYHTFLPQGIPCMPWTITSKVAWLLWHSCGELGRTELWVSLDLFCWKMISSVLLYYCKWEFFPLKSIGQCSRVPWAEADWPPLLQSSDEPLFCVLDRSLHESSQQ